MEIPQSNYDFFYGKMISGGLQEPKEKEMATHSSTLARTISWTQEPGALQSMGSQRVRHDSATNTHSGA